MMKDIRDILDRSHATIWQDVLGVVALKIILLGGLYLPGLI